VTRSGETAICVATLLAFLALGTTGILHHEMWRDELEIWLIARDSASPLDLLHNMRYEGHPALWYAINYGLARLSSDPWVMQLAHLLIGAAGAALFLWFAPFGVAHRVLFCGSYLVAYEFTVISRSYGLELLLALAFCALYPQRRRHHPWLALILFLLANTNLYGAILAAGLGLFAALEFLADRRRQPGPGGRGPLASAALAAGGIAIGVGQVWLQSRRIGASHSYVPELDLAWYADSLATLAIGYLPLPRFGSPHFWNTSALEFLPGAIRTWVGALLAAALVIASVRCLAGRPRVLLLFASGVGAMLLIVTFLWYGQIRQHAQPFLLFVLCAWLARCEPDSRPLRPSLGEQRRRRAERGERLLPRFLGVLLALQLVAAAYAYAQDFARPFSNSRAAGSYLRQQDLRGTVLVGSVDFAAQTLAAYVREPIYYPESGRFGSFVHWGRERAAFVTPPQVFATAARFLERSERGVVLITNYPMFECAAGAEFETASGVRVRCLARFEGAIVVSENFHLYWLGGPPE